MIVHLSGRFLADWQPAREQLESEPDGPSGDDDPRTRAAFSGLVAKIDAAEPRRYGRHGWRVSVDLTPAEAEFLEREARYRLDFHLENLRWGEYVGPEERDAGRRDARAAKAVLTQLRRA